MMEQARRSPRMGSQESRIKKKLQQVTHAARCPQEFSQLPFRYWQELHTVRLAEHSESLQNHFP